MKAAAKGYFGKQLKDRSASPSTPSSPAIPQSPTKFDLVKNAQEVCLDTRPRTRARHPTARTPPSASTSSSRSPQDSEIVQRRNYILDLMKTRSPLSGTKHTAAEYEAAKLEPVVIKQQVSATWRAAQFVWQVRDALAADPVPG